MSRYELNRLAAAVLVRHSVDTSRCQFSSTTTAVHLWGCLKKDPSGEFSPEGVSVLLEDLGRLPGARHVQAEFDNWNASRSEGAWLVTKKRVAAAAGPSRTLTITGEERLEDVADAGREGEKATPSKGKKER
jgi:hypothetical protein